MSVTWSIITWQVLPNSEPETESTGNSMSAPTEDATEQPDSNDYTLLFKPEVVGFLSIRID